MKKRWIVHVLAAALSFVFALPVSAEGKDAFLVQKSIEITQKLQLLAGSETYIKFLFQKESLEHAAEVAAADFSMPKRAIVLSASRELLAPVIEKARMIEPALVDDPVILESLWRRISGTLPNLLVSARGDVNWVVFNSVLSIDGTDALPGELCDIEYVLMFYPEQKLISLTAFSPVPRWGYVRYVPYILPLTDDDLSSIDQIADIGKLIAASGMAENELSAYIDLSQLEIRVLEPEALNALLP